MKRSCAVLMLMLLVAVPAYAAGPSVKEDKGNIVLVEAGGKKRKLTSSGQDSQPSLAPDGKAVVFVRPSSLRMGRRCSSFLGGGTYDWFWVLEPDGREVGPIGEDVTNFRELYLSEEPAPR